jgi:hypothetical protein
MRYCCIENSLSRDNNSNNNNDGDYDDNDDVSNSTGQIISAHSDIHAAEQEIPRRFMDL